MKRVIFLLIFLPLILVACQSKSVQVIGEKVETKGETYMNVEAQELNVMLHDKDFVLVNVHIPFAGNIAGTDLSIPYDNIVDNLSELPTDKNAKIVLYCRSGRMSQIAAERLVSLGYTNVWNLKGGMVQWEQAGYKIENSP